MGLPSNNPTTGVFTEGTINFDCKETLKAGIFGIDNRLYEPWLLSFKSWPFSGKIYPEQIVRAGFTYTKTTDNCRCNWCWIRSE